MCIVADSVSDISNTKIAVFSIAYTINGSREIIPAQLVVYSAEVISLAKENAFILPIYNPGNNYTKIVPLDLSDMPDFFVDLDTIYQKWFPKPIRYGHTLSQNSYSKDIELTVYQVGDYRFSIMPSKYDFNRLNRSQLNIDPVAKTSIDVHNDDYSFIVYQFFQKGKLKITPFGYICPLYQENAMIIPTIHGHPHNSIPDLGLNYVTNPYMSYKSDFEDKAEFDHDVYALVKNPYRSNDIIDMSDIVTMDKFVKNIKMDYMNRNIRIYIPNNFIPKKFKFMGVKDNRNMLIKDKEHNFIYDLTIDQR